MFYILSSLLWYSHWASYVYKPVLKAGNEYFIFPFTKMKICLAPGGTKTDDEIFDFVDQISNLKGKINGGPWDFGRYTVLFSQGVVLIMLLMTYRASSRSLCC